MSTTGRLRHARTSRTSTEPSGQAGSGNRFELREIALDRILLPRRPARRALGDIAALADSMREYGLQQPISVRAEGDRFVLTSGLRRLTAAQALRWTHIPAFVRTVDADQAYLLDLVENLQREDLSPQEEADALTELVRTRGWTLQQVADAVKRSVAYVSKRVRLFQDPLLRTAVAEQGLPVTTAEELLAADAGRRAALVRRAIAEHWDVTRARAAVLRGDGAEAGGAPMPDALTGADASHVRQRRASARRRPVPGRPRGFSRLVREFHRAIIAVRAEDLSAADRSALRSVFRDLVLLARVPTQPRSRDPASAHLDPVKTTGLVAIGHAAAERGSIHQRFHVLTGGSRTAGLGVAPGLSQNRRRQFARMDAQGCRRRSWPGAWIAVRTSRSSTAPNAGSRGSYPRQSRDHELHGPVRGASGAVPEEHFMRHLVASARPRCACGSRP
jgi:ParB family chromosome partitioning protein